MRLSINLFSQCIGLSPEAPLFTTLHQMAPYFCFSIKIFLQNFVNRSKKFENVCKRREGTVGQPPFLLFIRGSHWGKVGQSDGRKNLGKIWGNKVCFGNVMLLVSNVEVCLKMGFKKDGALRTVVLVFKKKKEKSNHF